VGGHAKKEINVNEVKACNKILLSFFPPSIKGDLQVAWGSVL
jgi:hypothetical protein